MTEEEINDIERIISTARGLFQHPTIRTLKVYGFNGQVGLSPAVLNGYILRLVKDGWIEWVNTELAMFKLGDLAHKYETYREWLKDQANENEAALLRQTKENQKLDIDINLNSWLFKTRYWPHIISGASLLVAGLSVVVACLARQDAKNASTKANTITQQVNQLVIYLKNQESQNVALPVPDSLLKKDTLQ